MGRAGRPDSLSADIGEGLHTDEALRGERDFISAILDTAGALVVVLDRVGCIVRFNRACERTTGYAFDEVKGKLLWDLLLISEEVEPVKAVYEALQAGQFPNVCGCSVEILPSMPVANIMCSVVFESVDCTCRWTVCRRGERLSAESWLTGCGVGRKRGGGQSFPCLQRFVKEGQSVLAQERQTAVHAPQAHCLNGAPS